MYSFLSTIAVVYMHWFGGFDGYNLLIPHSECGDFDMYQHYVERK